MTKFELAEMMGLEYKGIVPCDADTGYQRRKFSCNCNDSIKVFYVDEYIYDRCTGFKESAEIAAEMFFTALTKNL